MDVQTYMTGVGKAARAASRAMAIADTGAKNRALLAMADAIERSAATLLRENARDVLEAGADSVAVIAGLLPDSPTAQSLRQRMEEWQQLVKA